MLPLSHDEVVYGKNSILGRMPGDEWQRFANLRLLYGYMFTHPGTNLLFMGSEFGQYDEWNFQEGLDWDLLEFKPHQDIQNFYKELNKFYRETPALFEKQFSEEVLNGSVLRILKIVLFHILEKEMILKKMW